MQGILMPAFDATKIASEYITAVMTSLQNEASINDAILTRGIIIEDPATKGKSGNDATLATVKDQFGPNGNQIEGTTFTYHVPERRIKERDRFISTSLNDREQIALASAYFTAGVIAGKNFTGNSEVAKFLDAVQIKVADEMRNNKLFVKPLGYQVDTGFTAKMQILNDNAANVAQEAIANAQFKDELQKQFYSVSLQKKSILNHAGVNKPDQLKGNDADKYKILSIITAAIDKFGQDYDMKKLSVALTESVSQDNQRKKGMFGTHHTSELIQKIAGVVTRGVNARANSNPASAPTPTELSSRRSSTSSSGMFTKKPHHSTNVSISHNNSEPASEPPSPRGNKK
jgi:hypothetical protein